MDESNMEDGADIDNYMTEVVDSIRAKEIQLQLSRAELADLVAEKEKKIKDSESMRTQLAFMSRERELIAERRKCQDQQITMLQEVVIPQLLDELKRATKLVEAKKVFYASLLQKYADKWEEYLAIYKTFPRVAERDTLANKLKILQIEAAKKKQEMTEKLRQVEQYKEIQARQCEILKNQLQEAYTQRDTKRLQLKALREEVKERKARIAEKEAKMEAEQRQRLEEEEQRKLKEYELQQQQASESAQSNSNEDSEQPEKSTWSLQSLSIPTLSIPIPQFCKSILGRRYSPVGQTLSQGAVSTGYSKPHSQQLHHSISSSQPLPKAKSTQITAFKNCTSTEIKSMNESAPGENMLLPTSPVTILSQQMKHGQEATSPPANPTICHNLSPNLASKSKASISCFENLPSTPRSNKRELMLSTDKMVKKLKGTTPQPNRKSTDISMTDGAVHFQTSCEDGNLIEAISCNQIKESDQTPKEDSETYGGELKKQEDLKKQSECEAAITATDDGSSELVENLNPTSDHPYDFNQDFGEDMFNDGFCSPPQFDSMLSPDRPFDSSPSPPPSIDGNIKDIDGEFSGFNYFPKAAHNLFGGATSDDKPNDTNKSASSFSFLF